LASFQNACTTSGLPIIHINTYRVKNRYRRSHRKRLHSSCQDNFLIKHINNHNNGKFSIIPHEFGVIGYCD